MFEAGRIECLPRMSPYPKGQMFVGRGDRMISACRYILLNFAKLLKAKIVEIIGIRVEQCDGSRGHNRLRKRGTADQYLIFGVLRKSNERTVRASSRRVSWMELSILYILSIPASSSLFLESQHRPLRGEVSGIRDWRGGGTKLA